MGAARLPAAGEAEGVGEGPAAPSRPAKGVRLGEGEGEGVGEGENRPAAYTAEEAARCTSQELEDMGTPRPVTVPLKSTVGLLNTHRSASSTTSSPGLTTVAARGSVRVAATEAGRGVGAARRRLSLSAEVLSTPASSALLQASPHSRW